MGKSKLDPAVITMSDYKSTTDLVSNPGFQSTLTISSVDNYKEKEYNPYEHRQVQHPTSDFGALAHLLKSSLGSGILAVPNAFKSAGVVMGVIGTIVVGFVCTHTVQLVVKISYELCKKTKVPSMNLAETCEAVFDNGPKPLRKFKGFVRGLVDWGLIAAYLGITCVYVVLISDSFREVIGIYVGEEYNWSIQIYCLLLLLPLILMVQVRNLKYIVPFSTLANVLLFTTFGIIMYYIFQDIPPIDDKPLFNDVTKLPMFVSTVMFAIEGIGVVMPIENEMKRPGHFLGCPGVLNIAMVVVVILFIVIGLFGYLRFGENVLPTITATLCREYIPAQVAKIFVGFAILFTYPLQFYITMDIVFKKILPRVDQKHHNWVQVVVRTLGVTLSVIIGIFVPHLDLLISFVGAVFFSTVGLLVPSILDITYNWKDKFGFLWWKLWKDIIIGIFSIVALVSGAYLSLEEIIMGPSNPQILNSTCSA